MCIVLFWIIYQGNACHAGIVRLVYSFPQISALRLNHETPIPLPTSEITGGMSQQFSTATLAMIWYWIDPIGKCVTTILKVDGLEKDPSVNVSMGFLTDIGHARGVMHAGIANSRFPLKSVAGKCSQDPRRTCDLQFYVSGKRPMRQRAMGYVARELLLWLLSWYHVMWSSFSTGRCGTRIKICRCLTFIGVEATQLDRFTSSWQLQETCCGLICCMPSAVTMLRDSTVNIYNVTLKYNAKCIIMTSQLSMRRSPTLCFLWLSGSSQGYSTQCWIIKCAQPK